MPICKQAVTTTNPETGNALPASYIQLESMWFCNQPKSTDMTVRNTIRFLGVSLALVAMLVFSTVIVSGWHHHDSANDAQCPYCHLGHQAAVQPETTHRIAELLPLASLPLPEDSNPAISPVSSHIASRAPPSA